jgi:hypothetical protein
MDKVRKFHFDKRLAKIAANQIKQTPKPELAVKKVLEEQAKVATNKAVALTEVEASYAEAQRIAKEKGYTTALPEKKFYTGAILARTSHHIVSNRGRGQAIIHELNKSNLTKQQDIDAQVNETLKVNYRTAKATVEVVTREQAKQQQRENER